MKEYLVAALVMVSGISRALVVFQDTFDADGLSASGMTQYDNGAAWVDNGSLFRAKSSGSRYATVYTDNVFDFNADGVTGFLMTVAFKTSNPEARFGFGLNDKQNPDADDRWFRASDSATAGIGLCAGIEDASRIGLFNQTGSLGLPVTDVSLNAHISAGITHLFSLRVNTDNTYTYKINDNEVSGVLANRFDFSKKYGFAVHGQGGGDMMIESVKIEMLSTELRSIESATISTNPKPGANNASFRSEPESKPDDLGTLGLII